MLYDKLKKYSESDIYPFHMPGHKRVNITSDTIIPYNIDVTEIDSMDNLHNPCGCIKSVEEKAANLYSVKKAFLLINGATGGILSAVRALTKYGDNVLVARNCHKSVYNAIELCGLKADYITPETDVDFGIFNSISADIIEERLLQNKNINLVIITSPTYEGVASDIKSISKICKKYGVFLFVDEAHGAHFPFDKNFPEEAVKCGADAAVVSLHKTLPSLTQTALLITNRTDLLDLFSENLSVFETSSPSYILMSSIENCIDYINNNPSVFNEYINKLNKFYKNTSKLKKLRLLYSEISEKSKKQFYDYDIGKIVISTYQTDINGYELAKLLREKYKIETEMAYTDYVIAMTSVCDTEEGFKRLSDALIEIDSVCHKAEKVKKADNSEKDIKYSRAFYPYEKQNFKAQNMPFFSAEGKASLEYIWAYPPGIPLIVPGEIITFDMIEHIKYLLSNNIDLQSTNKRFPNSISVTEL